MKKILLVIVLAAGTYQLKAQQLLQVKPADSLSQKSIDNYLKLQIDSSIKLLKPEPFALNNSKLSSVNFNIDHMPIAVFDGNDHMPILKTDGHDNMPVLKTNNNDRLQTLPIMPTFKVPAMLGPAQQK
ncbi:hypothetical protein [Mucilaginibacter sp.]|uniref:hypothetical protein n=1 Tax=Mucilaginibacter sp. TaxID=1882438 RepID=UPI003D111FCD